MRNTQTFVGYFIGNLLKPGIPLTNKCLYLLFWRS